MKPRKRRERTHDYANGLAVQDAPNAVWAADFKGWFELKSGMCYPLTVSDGFSRYLLRCEALQHPDELACKEVFEAAEDIVKHGNVQNRMYLQQRVFDPFRRKYNTERPHEALKNEVPASLYVPSPKRYPRALRSPEYPADWDVYLVRRDGSIRVPGRDLFLSSVLVSEPSGVGSRVPSVTIE